MIRMPQRKLEKHIRYSLSHFGAQNMYLSAASQTLLTEVKVRASATRDLNYEQRRPRPYRKAFRRASLPFIQN